MQIKFGVHHLFQKRCYMPQNNLAGITVDNSVALWNVKRSSIFKQLHTQKVKLVNTGKE